MREFLLLATFFLVVPALLIAGVISIVRRFSYPRMTIICPNDNCAYEGEAKRKSRGSTTVLVILFLIGIIPGVIYLAMRGGFIYSCPQCGIQISSDA